MTCERSADQLAERHGDRHVAFDLDLAGHEGSRRAEIAGDQILEIAERQLDRAVRLLVVVEIVAPSITITPSGPVSNFTERSKPALSTFGLI